MLDPIYKSRDLLLERLSFLFVFASYSNFFQMKNNNIVLFSKFGF